MAEHEVQLLPNSKLILYTDGLTEAKNPAGEEFGSKRFGATLLRLGANLNADELGNKFMEEILEFMEGQPFHDDLTMVIVEIMSD